MARMLAQAGGHGMWQRSAVGHIASKNKTSVCKKNSATLPACAKLQPFTLPLVIIIS
jgi:hypothetical protein